MWRKVTAPSTITTYLGVEIDSVRMLLTLPQEKVDKFCEYFNKFVTAKTTSMKDLERLNGYISHCSQIVQGRCVFTRRCFDMYKQIVRSG